MVEPTRYALKKILSAFGNEVAQSEERLAEDPTGLFRILNRYLFKVENYNGVGAGTTDQSDTIMGERVGMTDWRLGSGDEVKEWNPYKDSVSGNWTIGAGLESEGDFIVEHGTKKTAEAIDKEMYKRMKALDQSAMDNKAYGESYKLLNVYQKAGFLSVLWNVGLKGVKPNHNAYKTLSALSSCEDDQCREATLKTLEFELFDEKKGYVKATGTDGIARIVKGLVNRRGHDRNLYNTKP
jgi:GH24 family phage-related lysozyme (muramidase)